MGVKFMPLQCPVCGQEYSDEAIVIVESEAICPDCGWRWMTSKTEAVETDAPMDDWLEGGRASVRSRRSFGEPRF